MSSPPTFEEICEIAVKAVTIFTSYGLRCCLFGSAACALYGTTRCPNDLDLVVFTDGYSQEWLKQLLTVNDRSFYLVPSRRPLADYKVLWYRLPSPGLRHARRRCKVDILVPGLLDIPHVSTRHINYISRIPVMPLLPLLLLKLRGWTDHRGSYRQDMQDKQHIDVEDIGELLAMAVSRGTHVTSNSLTWLPHEFVSASQQRVYDYVDEFPDSVPFWEDLGFQSGPLWEDYAVQI